MSERAKLFLPGTVAFVDVSVLPMDSEQVCGGQIVVFRNGRIRVQGVKLRGRWISQAKLDQMVTNFLATYHQ